MRVTNALFYKNTINNYQRNMQELYKTNAQIASGLKIQNSFEDSGTYVDTMRLNYEVATLEQVKESSTKAQTYANNTDKVLNQFSDSLTTFKTKLIQAANSSNSPTSLNALADELSSLREHMISLGNTSINGKYLFSGTAVTIKPLDGNGNYHGNNGKLEALIGSGVKLPYNINGDNLFLGKDSDYSRVLSTNVKMLDQIKLHPDSGQSKEIYLTQNNTIRDMVGDKDSDLTNDSDVVFYLSGRMADGKTFSSKLNISQNSKVNDLLDKIGQEYGNTSTNEVVNVTMNDHGQIEIKDLKNGNALLEMNIFGAVDRDGGTDANVTDIDDLLGNANVDIIAFSKSDFKTANTASTISSREDIYAPGLFKIGYPLHNIDGSNVDETTTLSFFMPSNVDNILVGTTPFTLPPLPAVQPNMQDLMTAIEVEYGLPASSVRLENGQIIVDDSTSTLNATLVARDSTNTVVSGFAIPDSMNYERRGFEKDGNTLNSNVSQVIKDTNDYAVNKTKLIDVAGIKTFDDISILGDETKFLLNGLDIDGNSFNAQIDLSNDLLLPNNGSTFSVTVINKVTGVPTTYSSSIFDANGNKTKADSLTYQQLNDVISMITSSKLPVDGVPANIPPGTNPPDGGLINFVEYNYAVSKANNSVEVGLDYRGCLEIKDRLHSQSQIEFSMFDENAKNPSKGSSLTFMANDAVKIEDPNIDFYKDLNQMIEAVKNGTFRMDSNSVDPRNTGIENSLSRIDHIMDHITNEHTKIGSYSNALSQANERSELLSINIKTVRSEVIDVDIGEAYMKFNQLSNSYQAMLSTAAKINSMSLLNYM